ncbi:MAG: hypothetical protein BRC34_04800 [Cyanobacteria bacterium QH_1_48_107]|nr:MAG: hypothetical protein BRC34_04800 [Cyanobacteria bacterium QH_1_48_107]
MLLISIRLEQLVVKVKQEASIRAQANSATAKFRKPSLGESFSLGGLRTERSRFHSNLEND